MNVTTCTLRNQHYTINIDEMHTKIYERGLGKCENRPPRHLRAALTPEQHGQEDCHTTRPRTASPRCRKALHYHHRHHARATSGARPRHVRKRTHKITSALECSTQAHRNHMWEHVEVINRHETLHLPHQHHVNDGGVTLVSGMAPVYVWAPDGTSPPRSLPVHVRGACF